MNYFTRVETSLLNYVGCVGSWVVWVAWVCGYVGGVGHMGCVGLQNFVGGVCRNFGVAAVGP